MSYVTAEQSKAQMAGVQAAYPALTTTTSSTTIIMGGASPAPSATTHACNYNPMINSLRYGINIYIQLYYVSRPKSVICTYVSLRSM
jgi:hypothetical protein